MKRTGVYRIKAETRNQGMALLDLEWEHAHQAVVSQFFTAPHRFMNNRENTVNIDLGLQIHFSEWDLLILICK